MQFEIKHLDSVKKEIVLTVEAEEVQKAYNKFLRTSAESISIPGFRKGKAPLQMVQRNYGERILEHFYEEYSSRIMHRALRENKVQYFLHPVIKDIQWEQGSDMIINAEIETEPDIQFTQVEGQRVPYKPLELQDEVNSYVESLHHENAIYHQVEDEIKDQDIVDYEVTFDADGTQHKSECKLYVATEFNDQHSLDAMGKKTGDSFESEFSSVRMERFFPKLKFKPEQMYQVHLLVKSITRKELPTLDDDFARDLEFENLEDMFIKITDEIREQVEIKNFYRRINALINKLYIDNKFELPYCTIDYLVNQEMAEFKAQKDEIRKYYIQNIRYKIINEFIVLLVMKTLRKSYEAEATDEDVEAYIARQAKLQDMQTDDWKQKYKEELNSGSIRETAADELILSRIADTCEFYPREEDSADERSEVSESIQEMQSEIDLTE